MNELALFAGAGGGILGGKLLGWKTVCAVELDAYAASVLVARQNDGCLAPFPIWDDVKTFDGRPWRGRVDVVSGGFPCQDISCSNPGGKGIDGEKSGLWSEMYRIVRGVLPRYVFIENSPNLVNRGLERVLSDLAEVGYDAEWGVLGADDLGAPHVRKRIWILANAHGAQRERIRKPLRVPEEHTYISSTGWWETECNVGRVADELAEKLDDHRASRLRCLGNGQVPAVAATAFALLQSRLGKERK